MMNSLEFAKKYLPPQWTERDLQLLIQYRLSKYFIYAPDEVKVKTVSTTRRIDLGTWFSIYEVKKYLTRDNIFHAVAQSELYSHYSSRILWIVTRKRIIVGLAPTDTVEYSAAKKVAIDYQKMGIEVIFLNEFMNVEIVELKTIFSKISLIAVILFVIFLFVRFNFIHA